MLVINVKSKNAKAAYQRCMGELCGATSYINGDVVVTVPDEGAETFSIMIGTSPINNIEIIDGEMRE